MIGNTLEMGEQHQAPSREEETTLGILEEGGRSGVPSGGDNGMGVPARKSGRSLGFPQEKRTMRCWPSGQGSDSRVPSRRVDDARIPLRK